VLWLPLLVAVALGCATAYVMNALRNEAGRKRLLPLLRPLMRVINPRVLRAIQRGESSYGAVRHSGRRSGATYQTPVDVARTSGGVLISLPYGPETNWCRNVLAAGGCTVTVDGEELALIDPEVLLTPEAVAQLPPGKQRQWEGEGIVHYLSMRYARGAQSDASSTATAAS
jgi:deazaflavin-dependent oxidoreductase (nitroreductase family)